MNDLVLHVVFFLALAVPVVVLGAFYGEPDDRPAFRSIPKRYAVFVSACAALAGVMLLCEALFL